MNFSSDERGHDSRFSYPHGWQCGHEEASDVAPLQYETTDKAANKAPLTLVLDARIPLP